MKNNWFKNIFYLTLFAIIFAFFFIFAWKIFDRIFFAQSNSNIQFQFLSAFAGAFFAFLFIRIGDSLSKIYDRAVKHFNALVKAEYQMNVYLNEINDNIFILESIKKAISLKIISLDDLKEFPINDDLLIELNNIEIIQDFFNLNINFSKANRSMTTVMKIYAELRNSFLDKKINQASYQLNLTHVQKNADLLIALLVNLDKKVVELLSKIRIKEKKDKPLLTLVMQRLSISKRIEDKELNAEIKQLEKEIEAEKEKSTKELKEIFKNEN